MNYRHATHSHRALCHTALLWLTGTVGCSFAVMETCLGSEVVDAFGWRAGCTVLVEVKVTRPDFTRDKLKPHRAKGKGVGNHRFYLCPPGLIKANEVPKGWGLLYWKNGRVFVIVNPAKIQVKDGSLLGYRWETVWNRIQHKCKYRFPGALLSLCTALTDDLYGVKNKVATRLYKPVHPGAKPKGMRLPAARVVAEPLCAGCGSKNCNGACK